MKKYLIARPLAVLAIAPLETTLAVMIILLVVSVLSR